eukprot:gene17260-18985_t
MQRIKNALVFTLCFAVVVLVVHYIYTRNYNLKDTAIHIVQSFQIDLKGKDGKEIDPHGNGITESKTVQDLPPEVQQTSKKKQESPVKQDTSPKQTSTTKEAIPGSTSKKESENKQQASPKQTQAEKTGAPNKPKAENESEQKLCNRKGDKLVGPLAVSKEVPDLEAVVKEYSKSSGGWVEKGGWSKPKTCKAITKTAIVIPYRKREEQLKIFLKHMHPVLKRQQLFYRILVVEQADDDPFNRAGLFNIGFVEALKLEQFDCFIFSDVDLLPEDDRNSYGCPTSPRHMSVAIDKFDYRLPYESIFGGVGAFKTKDFQSINGFSNIFWGWGGEDDDLYARIRSKGFHLTRPSMSIGRYTMVSVHHYQSHQANPNRMNLLQTSGSRMVTDGLNSLKYKLNKIIELPLVTILNVKLAPSQYSM